MTGTSAGASLCVYLAAMLKSPELAKAFQVVPNDLKIRALGLASGMYYTTKPDSIGIFISIPFALLKAQNVMKKTLAYCSYLFIIVP